MDALTFLGSLSEEDRNFLKTQQITSAKTAQNWIDFFRNCLDFDRAGDQSRKRYGWLTVLMIIPIFAVLIITLSFLYGIMLVPTEPVLIIIFIIFLLIFFAMIWLTYFLYSKYSKISAHNLRCNNAVQQQILPILMLLREETTFDQIVKLRLDLRGANIPEKMASNDPSFYDRGYNVTVSRFQDYWMDGETMLADGTYLIWNTQDFYTHLNKIRYKRKGRSKRKTKQKLNGLITMQVGMSEKRYNLPPKMKDKSEAGKMITKKQDGYHWMKIQHKLNYGEGSFHIKNFVDAIAAAYARATPVQGGK